MIKTIQLVSLKLIKVNWLTRFTISFISIAIKVNSTFALVRVIKDGV